MACVRNAIAPASSVAVLLHCRTGWGWVAVLWRAIAILGASSANSFLNVMSTIQADYFVHPKRHLISRHRYRFPQPAHDHSRMSQSQKYRCAFVASMGVYCCCWCGQAGWHSQTSCPNIAVKQCVWLPGSFMTTDRNPKRWMVNSICTIPSIGQI